MNKTENPFDIIKNELFKAKSDTGNERVEIK